MGWLSMIFGKSKTTTTIIPEASRPPLFEAVPKYLYNSTETFFTQLATIPKSLKDLWTDEPSQAITKSVLHTLQDIAPLIIMNASTSLLRSCLDEQASILSIDGSLLIALEMLNIGVNLYATRSLFKSYITTVCAPGAFNQPDNNQKSLSTICKPECNGAMVLLNGAANETAAYYSNLLAVWALGKVPYIGLPLSEIASIYATGRYVAGLTTPRCREHEFLKSEATLSLGLIHKGFEYIMWNSHTIITMGLLSPILKGMLIEIPLLTLMLNSFSVLRLPSPILRRILNEIPLLLTISIAAHQTAPLIVTKANRTLVDPMEVYENITGFVFEGACTGYKDQIQKLLSGPPSTIPWGKIGNQALDIVQHPYAYNTRNFFLPPMLHNWEFFINEPIISPRWTAVQKQLISIFVTLEDASRSNLVNLANKAPDKAAGLLQFIFGFPRPVAKILLDVMGNDYYMKIVNKLRCWLELNEVKKDTGLIKLEQEISLRTNAEIKLFIIRSSNDSTTTELKKFQPVILPTPPDLNTFFQPPKRQDPMDPSMHLVKKYK